MPGTILQNISLQVIFSCYTKLKTQVKQSLLEMWPMAKRQRDLQVLFFICYSSRKKFFVHFDLQNKDTNFLS